MNRKIISATFTISLLACVGARAQEVARRPGVSVSPESARRMLAAQPDFTAMQQFFFSEGFGGFGAKNKVVKLGNRMAEVTEDTTFISEPGKPTIKVFHTRKEYSETPVEEVNDFSSSPEELARRNDVVFRSMGMERIGKHHCVKIRVSFKQRKLRDIEFLFWAAPELKNLVIKSEATLGHQVKFMTLLEEVQLTADESLFRVPADYKKVADPDAMEEPGENSRPAPQTKTPRRSSH